MNSFQGGYNRKGLLDEQRKTRKKAWDVVRIAYEEHK